MKNLKYLLLLITFNAAPAIAGEIGSGEPEDTPNVVDETNWWDELLSSEDIDS